MDSGEGYGFCRRPRSARTASPAPTSCETTNAGTFARPMPANVALKPRASVTAGLAKEVEAVNQYAAAM